RFPIKNGKSVNLDGAIRDTLRAFRSGTCSRFIGGKHRKDGDCKSYECYELGSPFRFHICIALMPITKHATKSAHCILKSSSQNRMLLEAWLRKKAPQTLARLGRETVLPNYFRLVARKNFEQVVFAVLLGKEKPRLAFLDSHRVD